MGVHNALSCEYTYLDISPKRGFKGMEQKRAPAFTDLLLEMKKAKDKAVEKGKDSLSYYHHHKFDKKYDELIEQARNENPLPETTEKKRGRKKKGKSLLLWNALKNTRRPSVFL